jgi:hypothetical protein
MEGVLWLQMERSFNNFGIFFYFCFVWGWGWVGCGGGVKWGAGNKHNGVLPEILFRQLLFFIFFKTVDSQDYRRASSGSLLCHNQAVNFIM